LNLAHPLILQKSEAPAGHCQQGLRARDSIIDLPCRTSTRLT
jgi:hypothetical protein